MDESQDESLSAIQVDASLENRLEAHGITRRNVRSIIHGIFSDENVLRLLKTAECDPKDLDLPEAPLTRSKRQVTGQEFPDFGWFDGLPPEDDLELFPYDDEDGLLCADPDGTNCVARNENVTRLDVNTESCFDDNSKFDWQTWLTEFDGKESTKAILKPNQNDSDSDPDYNFLEEVEEKDAEDYRDDRMTRISKEELRNLAKINKLHEKSNSRIVASMQRTANTGTDKRKKAVAINDFLNSGTSRAKLRILRRNPELRVTKRRKRKYATTKLRNLSFTKQQSDILNQQMQQHVQLLCQTCVLDWQRSESFTEAQNFLQELEYFRFLGPFPQLSNFNVANLNEGCSLVKKVEKSEILQGNDKRKMHLIANSKVFMYKELLPDFALLKAAGRRKFTFHEDCLIAHGMFEMAGCLAPVSELASQLLLPGRTGEAIKSRIKTILRGNTRSSASNPVLLLKTFNTLPPACEKVSSIAFKNAESPIMMEGDLPLWLESIQQCHRSMESDPSDSLNNKNNPKRLLPECNRPYLGRGRVAKGHKPTLAVLWSKQMDAKILSVCKHHDGLSKNSLTILKHQLPMRSVMQIKKRFFQLMKLFADTAI